jgi:hypothetical protein
MRAKKTAPPEREFLVHRNPENTQDGRYTWFESKLNEIGNIEYQAINRWVTDDGRVHSSPWAGLRHLREMRSAEKPMEVRSSTITPGTWRIDGWRGSKWSDDRRQLMIETSTGTITIDVAHADDL